MDKGKLVPADVRVRLLKSLWLISGIVMVRPGAVGHIGEKDGRGVIEWIPCDYRLEDAAGGEVALESLMGTTLTAF